jgi:hypothetical protein
MSRAQSLAHARHASALTPNDDAPRVRSRGSPAPLAQVRDLRQHLAHDQAVNAAADDQGAVGAAREPGERRKVRAFKVILPALGSISNVSS